MEFKALITIGAAAMVGLSCATPPPPSAPPDSDRTIRGASGRYELTVSSGSWQKAEPGSIVKELNADLELTRADSGAWIFVNQMVIPNAQIDAIVSHRRSAFLETGYTSYSEMRTFLAHNTFVPASFARYAGGSHAAIVMTAVNESLTLEVVASTRRGLGLEPEILKILESVRFTEEDLEP